MRFRWACLLVCAAEAFGCASPQPELTHVSPAQAESESDVRLTVYGDHFVPACTVDPVSGSRTCSMNGFHLRVGKGEVWGELEDLRWADAGTITATLNSQVALGLPYGLLDVELVDPRGKVAVLSDGFTEVGPDITPPVVTFTSPSPSTPVLPGLELRGAIVASDPPAGHVTSLRWTYWENDRQLAGDRCQTVESPCPFDITVSAGLAPGTVVRIVAEAYDGSANANHGQAQLQLTVLAIPSIIDITPSKGGTAGGSDVVITGKGLLPGTRALVDKVEPLFPNGGIVSADGSFLSGHMPAHAAGNASIVLFTYGIQSPGSALFLYEAPPQILSIEPVDGPTQGGTAVSVTGTGFTSSTQILFGPTLQTALPLRSLYLQSSNTIVGVTPSGRGTVALWAFDDALGFTYLPGAFTWRAP